MKQDYVVLGIPFNQYIAIGEYIQNSDISGDITVKDFLDNNGLKYNCLIDFGKYSAVGIQGFFINRGEINGVVVNNVKVKRS